MSATEQSSFSSFRAYLHALSQTPQRLSLRATAVSSSSDDTARFRSRSGAAFRRTLRWYDLLGLGVGGMVGAGVFVTTGHAARLYAGPSVVLSYAIAGLCALLSAFCYSEFAVDVPVAGGAFSYLRASFGEFAAFFTGANLLMDYVLSNAAVARSFTAYLSMAAGLPPEKCRLEISTLPDGFNQIDIVAVLVILTITLIICHSTRESSTVNLILTAAHLAFIAFVVTVGFWKGDSRNFTLPADPDRSPAGFFPFGAAGVFNGAAVVYLSFVGYDAVSTMTEEVKDPVNDIPIGIAGSVAIVTVLYCLMAASMSMLLPYDLIDPEAPFSGAFIGEKGWDWVSNVIGVGASFGIWTSLMVAMMGQARYMCVIGRSSVVPVWFARIHHKTSTPINASAFLGILTASVALFTDLNILLDLVSIGTLFVFFMVANAVIYRRYVIIGTTNPWPTLSFLSSLSLTSLIFTLIWHLTPVGSPKAFVLATCFVIAISLLLVFRCLVPQARQLEFQGIPFMPWLPSISVFLNVFLLGSLNKPSYVRFLFFSGFVVLVYVLYSVHASFDEEGEGCSSQKDLEVVGKGREMVSC